MMPPMPSHRTSRQSTTYVRLRTIDSAWRRISCDDAGVRPPPSDAPLIIRGRRVVTPTGVRPASIHIAGGRITRVCDWEDATGGDLVDAHELIVMPGVIDTHVHVNEPGRTEWEGFETATR